MIWCFEVWGDVAVCVLLLIVSLFLSCQFVVNCEKVYTKYIYIYFMYIHVQYIIKRSQTCGDILAHSSMHISFNSGG